MGKIPEDAAQWDSGDWIEWHRTAGVLDDRPCDAAAQEPMARLTALHLSLLRAAKGYFQMTGQHLPVYRQIAHVHAALHCDLPLEGTNRSCETTGVEILYLPPHGPDNCVDVDLTRAFVTLIVVRIKDNFTSEARMIQRSALPDHSDGPYRIGWKALPYRL